MFKKKKRLISLIGLFLIVGALLTSVGSYLIAMGSLRDQITNSELPLTSDTIYSEIQRDMLRPIFISSLMASNTFLRDWAISEAQDPDAIERFLKEIQQKYNTVSAFFVSEKNHTYFHADGLVKTIQPDDPRDSWYFRVRDMTEDFEINVDMDLSNNDALTVFINYRVYDYEKNFIGATGVGLTVESIQELINNYQEKYEKDVYLIDKEGAIQLSNVSTEIRKQKTKILDQIIKKQNLLNKILSADSVTLECNHEDESVLINTRFIEEFDWYLVVMQKKIQGRAKLLKTLLLNLLLCIVITAIVLFIVNRTIASYQKQIEQMAITDELTGLYNRKALNLFFKALLLDQIRKPGDLALLMLDIDHFKKVNDEHGHLAGDAVLKHLATLITSRLRKTDIICRWGGEEFLLLLKECDPETAINMAEELRLSILNNPLYYHDKEIAITVSIGISSYQPEDSRESMFNRADEALYKAKSNGRNQSITL